MPSFSSSCGRSRRSSVSTSRRRREQIGWSRHRLDGTVRLRDEERILRVVSFVFVDALFVRLLLL